ncbi:MAG: flagellar basal body rod protein FlgB [Rhodospirillales bacterium]
MDIGKTRLFDTLKANLAWLGQRQHVLARNIANADTPGYRSRDIEPTRFEAEVRRQADRLDLRTTSPAHLATGAGAAGRFAERPDRRPFETSPNGNSVVLEEQLAKLNETSVAHKLTTQLYRKHLGMIRAALGGR